MHKHILFLLWMAYGKKWLFVDIRPHSPQNIFNNCVWSSVYYFVCWMNNKLYFVFSFIFLQLIKRDIHWRYSIETMEFLFKTNINVLYFGSIPLFHLSLFHFNLFRRISLFIFDIIRITMIPITTIIILAMLNVGKPMSIN